MLVPLRVLDQPVQRAVPVAGQRGEETLLEVVGERRVRGGIERRIRLRSGAATIDPDAASALTLDDHRTGFAAATVGAVRGLDGPGRSVDDVARDVGLSPRALRRRFRDDVGYGPKALHRVLRFRRTLAAMGALACGRLTLAAAAARFGYADQAHLCREARALAGSGPTELIQTWASHGDRSGRNVQDSAAGPGRSCDT